MPPTGYSHPKGRDWRRHCGEFLICCGCRRQELELLFWRRSVSQSPTRNQVGECNIFLALGLSWVFPSVSSCDNRWESSSFNIKNHLWFYRTEGTSQPEALRWQGEQSTSCFSKLFPGLGVKPKTPFMGKSSRKWQVTLQSSGRSWSPNSPSLLFAVRAQKKPETTVPARLEYNIWCSLRKLSHCNVLLWFFWHSACATGSTVTAVIPSFLACHDMKKNPAGCLSLAFLP